MAYDPSIPISLRSAYDRGGSIWAYVSATDSQATMAASGYFSNGRLIGVLPGDIVIIYAVSSNITQLYQVLSFVGTGLVITPLAGGGGGGGIATEQVVSSGSTATAALNQIVIFNSASGAPKTLNAPTATGSLSIIEAVDEVGDADSYPITFTPSSGSVIGTSVGQNQLYTKFSSGKWRDTSQGWVRVG